MTDVIRHGRPSKAFLATLRKATKADMARLAVGAITTIIEGEVDLIVSFPYTFKFPAGFPKGLSVGVEGSSNLRRIKARKLLTWLQESGYTDVTVESIKLQRAAFTKFENNFLNSLDLEEVIEDNSFTQAANP